MGEDIIRWLQLPSLWLALGLGFAPALIARFKRLPTIRWYLYGFACALVAWPLAALPTLHALVAVGRPRHRLSEQDRQRQRRADALALLAESSVVSYPSRIAELRRKSPAGIDRRHYAYEHIGPGEPLELVREPTNGKNDRAVAYYHHGVHLGYVPKRQRWIADALDDGLHLVVVAENIRMGWIFRHRATSVGTRIVVLPNGR
jgi:hypothetical protein